MSQVKNDYPDYPVFKGLLKPLEYWVFEEDTLFGQLALLAEDSYLS